LKGASPSKSRRVSDESITLKLEQTRLEVVDSEVASKRQVAILLQDAVGKTKAPVPLTDYPEPKRTKRFYFKGDSSPEAESEGDTETETGSREHMERAQTKSESEIKVSVSRDSLEADSEALSENWIKSTWIAGTERLFSLKSILLSFLNLNDPGTAIRDL